MASFIVMRDKGAKLEDNIRFVRDGFAIVAFVVPVIWLLWYRLWLHAALLFAVFGICAGLVAWNSNPIWIGLSGVISFLISLLVALEGGEWLRQSLVHEGFHEVALVPAHSMRQAEEFYAGTMVETMVRKPGQGFAPVSPVSLIPLTGA